MVSPSTHPAVCAYPGQQQIHHYPRWHEPDPRLQRPSGFQHIIDHLERHDPGQLTDVAAPPVGDVWPASADVAARAALGRESGCVIRRAR
jgi:hypothetical protein